MSQELAPIHTLEVGKSAPQDLYQPVMSIETAIARRDNIVQFVKRIMVQDQDFGVIPGTNSKPVLLKPGAEKLCNFFGLEPEFTPITEDADWTGAQHGGEPFYYIRYRCRLLKNGIVMGVGEGSCNSWESKYRYRDSKRVCPACGKDAIIKGKEEYGGGWLCFAKKGGCGAKFGDKDKSIVDQAVGRVANPDVADQVNTIQKMAQKRALVPATLLATSGSEFFTQDLEDAPQPEPPDAQRNTPEQQAELAKKRIAETAAAPATEAASQVPAALKALFDNLGKPGYVKQAYELLRGRLVELSPDGGGDAEYKRIVELHGANKTKELATHKAAMLDMWNVCEEWASQKETLRQAELGITDDDVPTIEQAKLEDDAKQLRREELAK